MDNTTGAVYGAGTAYPSGAPGFTPGFYGVRVDPVFSFLCCSVLSLSCVCVFPGLSVILVLLFLIAPSVFSSILVGCGLLGPVGLLG